MVSELPSVTNLSVDQIRLFSLSSGLLCALCTTSQPGYLFVTSIVDMYSLFTIMITIQSI